MLTAAQKHTDSREELEKPPHQLKLLHVLEKIEKNLHRSLFGSVPQNVDAAATVGEEEHVVIVVPGNLVHLELEMLLSLGAMCLGIDKGHHIIFVTDCDGLTVGAPANVDIFT